MGGTPRPAPFGHKPKTLSSFTKPDASHPVWWSTAGILVAFFLRKYWRKLSRNNISEWWFLFTIDRQTDRQTWPAIEGSDGADLDMVWAPVRGGWVDWWMDGWIWISLLLFWFLLITCHFWVTSSILKSVCNNAITFLHMHLHRHTSIPYVDGLQVHPVFFFIIFILRSGQSITPNHFVSLAAITPVWWQPFVTTFESVSHYFSSSRSAVLLCPTFTSSLFGILLQKKCIFRWSQNGGRLKAAKYWGDGGKHDLQNRLSPCACLDFFGERSCHMMNMREYQRVASPPTCTGERHF